MQDAISCALRTRDKGGRGHKLEPRKDFVSNALTSVSKDTLVIEFQNEKGSVNINENSTQAHVKDTRSFNYVSLFSGIGGFETALNGLGGHCVMSSEIAKYANQAYEVLYGEPTVGDVTKIDAADVPDHDVLVGGFPCQAFSVAGKRGGFDDARGTLFFEVARIAKIKRPKVVLLENVKGLVSHDKGKTLDTIISTLCEIGYTVDFNVLNSKYFGVPQNRERIFIVGVLDGANADWTIDGSNVVAKGKRRIAQIDGIKTFNFDWPEQGEVTTRLRDILEHDVDKQFYLSEEKTAKLAAQLDGTTIGSNEGIEWHGDLKTQAPIYPRNYLDVYGVMGTEGVSQCLRTMQGGNREPKIAQLGNTNPSGNGMNGAVYDIDAGLAPTLTTNKGEGSRITSAPQYRIRKLTPRECWRLQGFSDEQHDAVANAGISNSQRYKMAGNAVTVNVIRAIGERLMPLL